MLSRMPFSGRIAVFRLRCHVGHVCYSACHFRPKATTALFKHRTKAEAETPSDRPAGMRSRRPSYAIPKTVLCDPEDRLMPFSGLPFSGCASPFSGLPFSGCALPISGCCHISGCAMPYLRLLPYLRPRFAISQAVLPYLRLRHISGGIAISQASPYLRRCACGHACKGGARDSRAMAHRVSMNRRRRT